MTLESHFWLAVLLKGTIDEPPLIFVERAIECEVIAYWLTEAWARWLISWVASEADFEVKIGGAVGGAPDFEVASKIAGALNLRCAIWGQVGEAASPLLSLLCELPVPAGESVCQPILGV